MWGRPEFKWGRLKSRVIDRKKLALKTFFHLIIIVLKMLIKNTTHNREQLRSKIFMNINRVRLKCGV